MFISKLPLREVNPLSNFFPVYPSPPASACGLADYNMVQIVVKWNKVSSSLPTPAKIHDSCLFDENESEHWFTCGTIDKLGIWQSCPPGIKLVVIIH